MLATAVCLVATSSTHTSLNQAFLLYSLITFSYKGYLLGEPILQKHELYEYVLQGTIFIYHVYVWWNHKYRK